MAGSARNLIVLSDGTGNSASKSSKTNVWRLYQAIDLTDGTQIAVFGDGVGTSSVKLLRILGLALGIGVKRNVLNLYKFLCRNYVEGDQIWAFGFSRGAFTIRLLVGLIAQEGLVSWKDEAELNRNALAAYRSLRKMAFPTKKPWVVAFRYIRDEWTSTWNALTRKRSYAEIQKETIKFRRAEISVHFVGVWDTVAAYGLPIDELTQAIDKWVLPMTFTDRTLSTKVENARHALSLEDDRKTFHPIPWDETAEKKLVKIGAVEPGRLRQVWFAGAHADVGGGYPDDGLSLVALGWMIGEAADKGLRFMPSIVADFAALATPTGRIYDPRSGLGALWRYQPRDTQLLLGEGNTPIVYGSVMTRIVCGTEGYAPISLPQDIAVLPPYGPPVAFADLEKSLAEANPGGKALSRDALENQRLVLKNSLTVAAETGKLPQRADIFKLVLDTVWWRRINYFVSLGFVLIAAAFPFLANYLPIGLEQFARPVGTAIELMGGFLPRFLEPWITSVREHPVVAAAVLVGLLVNLRFSAFLQGRICDRARAAWNVGTRVDRLSGVDPAKPGFSLSIARKLRTASWSVGAYRFAAQKAAPIGFLFLAAVAVLSLGNRAAFDLLSSGGAYCIRDMPDPGEEKLGESTFQTKSMCHPTGLRLVEGGTYRIQIDMDKDLDEGLNREWYGEWFDKNRRTDVAGFATDSVLQVIALPLKRWWRENWFQSVARIGKTGNYEHVLWPAASLPGSCQPEEKTPLSWRKMLESIPDAIRSIPGALRGIPDALRDFPSQAPNDAKREQLKNKHCLHPNRTLISDVTADATGELFIYVNDAVLALPISKNIFYLNNSGSAKVTVKRVLADSIIESPQ